MQPVECAGVMFNHATIRKNAQGAGRTVQLQSFAVADIVKSYQSLMFPSEAPAPQDRAHRQRVARSISNFVSPNGVQATALPSLMYQPLKPDFPVAETEPSWRQKP